MTDVDALYAEIIANPGEDTIRLMWADAVEERGFPGDADRAEFVRVQCELETMTRTLPPGQFVYSPGGVIVAKTMYDTDNPDWKRLHARERELVRNNHGEWTRDHRSYGFRLNTLPRLNDKPLTENHVRYRRGFISDIGLSAEDWLQHGDELVKRLPIENVTWTTLPDRDRLTVFHDDGYTAWFNGRARSIKITDAIGRNALNHRVEISTVLCFAEWPKIKFSMPLDISEYTPASAIPLDGWVATLRTEFIERSDLPNYYLDSPRTIYLMLRLDRSYPMENLRGLTGYRFGPVRARMDRTGHQIACNAILTNVSVDMSQPNGQYVLQAVSTGELS